MDIFQAVRTREIESVPMPSDADFQRDYVARRRPVLLDGVLERLPGGTDWSLQKFSESLKTIRVQRPSEDGVYHYLGFKRIPFEEFAQILRTSRDAYALEPLLGVGAPAEANAAIEWRIPGFIPRVGFRVSNLYFGPGGNKSLLHYDETHSFLTMVEGVKRFVLFGPEQTKRMYPYGVLNIRSILEGRVIDSRVNADDLDLDRFPAIRKAVGVHGTMRPGQALYIPAGTWHYISAEDVNVSVNYFWFQSSLTHWLRRPLLDFWFKRRVVLAADRARAARSRLRAIWPSDAPSSGAAG